jgi:outer membrane protein assembly factor BamB
MRRRLGVIVLVLLPAGLSAQEWTQWRGANRDASLADAHVPAAWPSTLRRVWRVEIGEGYSSPVVAGTRVFVHSRREPSELVTALDLETGKAVWQQTYEAPFRKNQYASQMAKGPNSTPLVAEGLLYTLGATGVLSAWRMADGTLAWRNDYSSAVDTSKLFCGTSMSPMIDSGSLVVQVGSDVHGGRLLALDPATGEERWAWKGPGPGYASPIGITVDGVRQLVTLTNQSIVGIDAGRGTSLWSVPFPDEWHENIITPVWTGSHLIVSGVRQGTRAFVVTRESKSAPWRATEAWRNAEVTMYMSAPVVTEGTIYAISSKRKGQFVAVDVATGKLRWSTEGREGEHASIVTAPEHVLFLTNAGDLVVARKDAAQFVAERRIAVTDGETWAMPAFVNGGLIVRDAQALMRLSWSD